MYHSDKAIQEFDEDLLGRATFARQLAHSVLSIDLADSFAIGIYGKWGTGKTSVLNMMQKEINANTQTKTNLHLANFGGVEVLSSIQMNPGWVHHGPTGSTHSKETLEQRKTVILHELYWQYAGEPPNGGSQGYPTVPQLFKKLRKISKN